MESIEQKRGVIAELEESAREKARIRDEREGEMVDLEKQLVQILVEQQKVVLGFVEKGRDTAEKMKAVVLDCRVPWPPPEAPTMKFVESLVSTAEADT